VRVRVRVGVRRVARRRQLEARLGLEVAQLLERRALLLHRGLHLLVEDVDALDRRVQPGHRRGAALVVGAQPRLGLR